MWYFENKREERRNNTVQERPQPQPAVASMEKPVQAQAAPILHDDINDAIERSMRDVEPEEVAVG